MRYGKRLPWRRLRNVVLAIALLAMFAAARVNGGVHYLYCAAMDEVMTSCCCAPSKAAGELPAVERTCCCSTHVIAVLPSMEGPAREVPAPGPARASNLLVHNVPLVAIVHPRGTRGRPRARGTGPPPSGAERRARIQVYLI